MDKQDRIGLAVCFVAGILVGFSARPLYEKQNAEAAHTSPYNAGPVEISDMAHRLKEATFEKEHLAARVRELEGETK